MSNDSTFLPQDYALTSDEAEQLNSANCSIVKLRMRRVGVVRASDAGGVTSWLADAFFQHGLHRIVALADGAIGEWNARRPTNAVLLVRSLFECVASWNYVGGRIRQLADAENIREIHQILLQMRFGIRHRLPTDTVTFPQSVNVMTFVASLERPDAIIDSLEAFVPRADGHKVFRHFYDGMSEYVHPNEQGLAAFGVIDHDAQELHLSDSRPVAEGVVLGRVLFASVLLDLADKFLDLYELQMRHAIISLEAKLGREPADWSA